MKTTDVTKLLIVPEFAGLIQKRSEQETRFLREALLKDPSLCMVNEWNGYLLDDPLIYDICVKESLDLKTTHHSFEDPNGAAVFICSNQLKREDLTVSFRKYLIGKYFEYEEKINTNKEPKKSGTRSRTAYKIGIEQDLSGGAVLKYNVFSAAIDKISTVADDLAVAIIMDEIMVSHENTLELSRLAPNEIRHIAKVVNEQRLKHLTIQDIRHEIQWKHTKKHLGITTGDEKESSVVKPNKNIRQMPAYDPDAEVNSLCMTISSWVSSIERLNSKVDFSVVSNRAVTKMVRQLTILERSIKDLQQSLSEREM